MTSNSTARKPVTLLITIVVAIISLLLASTGAYLIIADKNYERGISLIYVAITTVISIGGFKSLTSSSSNTSSLPPLIQSAPQVVVRPDKEDLSKEVMIKIVDEEEESTKE